MQQIQWHATQNGTQQGPLSDEALRQWAAEGRLRPTDLVWREGMPQWVPAGGIPGLIPAQLPPPIPVVPIASYAPPTGYGAPDPLGQNAGMRMLLPVGRSGWAIAAGYLGLLSFILLPAPLALIISIIAILDIKKHPDRHGMGRAIFGLVMGILGTIALGFALVAATVSHH